MGKMVYPKDLTGLHFGKLTVIGYAEDYKWTCKCDCGEYTNILRSGLVSGNSTSCGKCIKKARLNNIAGEQFIDLTAIEYDCVLKRWKCICSCGNIVYRRSWDLRNGKATKCGDTSKHRSKRLNDLTGETCGELIVKEYAGENKWVCECSCGRISTFNAAKLKSGQYKDCGHSNNLNDLTGRKFGNLIVLDYIGYGQWECECSCGEIIKCKTSVMVSGVKTSCGHDKISKLIDLTGERFGTLEVIKYIQNLYKWECQCDCGNTVYIPGQRLRDGDNKSCGCSKVVNLEDIILKLELARSNLGRKPTYRESEEYTGYTEGTLRKYLGNNRENYILLDNSVSQPEIELRTLIESVYNGEIEYNDRKLLKSGKEIDILLKNRGIGIEFNGTYWHSTVFKDAAYHQAKVIEAAKHGIRIINIYEHEIIQNRTKIEQYLLNILNNTKNKLYARRLKMKTVGKEEACTFLDMYHLQGSCGYTLAYGLYDNDELIQLITIGKPRFNKNYEYELIRVCTKANTLVVGGFNRLLKHFIKEHTPKDILSYVNLDKFNGESYVKAGFTIDGITSPGYIWTNSRSTKVLSRYQTQKDKLIENGIGSENETEDEIMRSLHYLKIYNAGNIRFVWKPTNN